MEQLGELKTSPEAGIGSVFNSVDRRVGNVTDFVEVSPSGPTVYTPDDHRSKKSSSSLSESMISEIDEDDLPNFMLGKIEPPRPGYKTTLAGSDHHNEVQPKVLPSHTSAKNHRKHSDKLAKAIRVLDGVASEISE